jgi:dihydroorotate dehydrogenase (NAD+) catalytic subunit
VIPILNASGCLDALTAPEVARSLDAYVTKTLTPRPREGNAPIRIAETEAGMLNSIGLANPGIDRFLEHYLPRLTELDVSLWVSIGGFAVDDYAALASVLDGRDEVQTIELNVSCPNVEETPESAADVVSAARAQTSKPLYVKLSPAVADIAAAAVAVQSAGADGLSLVNTIRGLALDATLRPVLGTAAGGYSGPALKPVSLAAVYACYRATGLPIVGMGGVTTGAEALEFIAAGACSVALGTVLFSDPAAPNRIRQELEIEVARLAVVCLDDMIGFAHRAEGQVHTLDSSLRVGV